MRWLEEISRIEQNSYGRDVLFNNQFYSNELSTLFTATKGSLDRSWSIAFNSHDYAQAEKEAELLQKAILDEDLPYHVCLMTHSTKWDGGRYWDAFLLGRIKYWEASDALFEAASHDLDDYMRSECLEALGWMEEKSFHYASGIASLLMNDRSYWVKKKAANVLGRIGNPIVVPTLRDAFDDVLPLIVKYEQEGYPFLGQDKYKKREMEYSLSLLEHSIRALFALDPILGREALSHAYNFHSRSIRHFAKRAALWTGINVKNLEM